MAEAKLLIDFISEINSYPVRHFSNDPKKNHKQSAVAMIFRCAPALEKELNLPVFQGPNNKINLFIPSKNKLANLFKNFLEKDSKDVFELLFVQRAISEKDLHSGEICFPGGKCDNSETDYEAVIREVKEEIDYDLMTDENSIYLGKLPKNFYVYLSRSGELYVSVHIFLLLNYENVSQNSKFNIREVSSLKWLPLNHFTSPAQESLILKKTFAKKVWAQNYPKIVQKIFYQMLKSYERSEYPGVNIGMNETLYGLTFFMVIYMLWVMKVTLKDEKAKKEIDKILIFSKNNRMIFKNDTFLTRFGGWVAGNWYRKYRISEFKYMKKENEDFLRRCVYLVCYLLVIFMIMKFFEII